MRRGQDLRRCCEEPSEESPVVFAPGKHHVTAAVAANESQGGVCALVWEMLRYGVSIREGWERNISDVTKQNTRPIGWGRPVWTRPSSSDTTSPVGGLRSCPYAPRSSSEGS